MSKAVCTNNHLNGLFEQCAMETLKLCLILGLLAVRSVLFYPELLVDFH